MRYFAKILADRAQEINDLNVFPVPDSDTGSNCELTLNSGLADSADLDAAAEAGLGEVVALLGTNSAKAAMGNSGIILSEYIRGIGTVLDDQADAAQWARALLVGAQTAREAVLHPEVGTMLTVADAAASVSADPKLENYLIQIQRSVRISLVETQNLLPVLTAAGVVDAGAVVIALMHDAIASQIGGSSEPELVVNKSVCEISAENYSGPAFELMFGFTGSASDKSKLEIAVSEMGDSISVAGDETGFRFHIHTDDPEKVLAVSQQIVSVDRTRIHTLIKQ